MNILLATGVLPMTEAPILHDAAVVMDNGRIVEIRPREVALQLYPEADVETSTGWALPGFIDAHVHLAFSSGGDPLSDILNEKDSPDRLAVRMIRNAQLALLAGVTTVRDCGAGGNGVFAVRDAIRAGLITGCDIVACGQPFTVTGGHCWFLNREVDGVADVTRCARQTLKDGADFLKMMISGGNMTPGSSSGVLQYTQDEVVAFAREARMRGKKTAVHVHSTESIRLAVEAGVSTLEHASFQGKNGNDYDAALVDTAIQAGIMVCPAFSASYRTPITSFPPERREFWAGFRKRRMDVTAAMLRQGVELAHGTDAGCHLTRFEDFALSLPILHEQLGLSAAQVLNSATRLAAKACGLEHEIGALAPGYRADMVILRGNPLDDLHHAQQVAAVYKAGKVVVREGGLVL